MSVSKRIFIQEVAPRDGLQIEQRFVATADKIALIDALSATGVAKIEVSSFVSPRAVPNLRDAAEVFAGIRRRDGVVHAALVPNVRGAVDAMSAGADELNLVMSASDTHNLANMRMTGVESLRGFRQIFRALQGDLPPVNGTVATAFGCPFEGPQDSDRILMLVEKYMMMGCRSITLADTTGMANPRQVGELVSRVLRRFQDLPLTLHFHNTRGMGLANVLAAVQAGAMRFDASLGGLGGCPFAPGATGNVCTEDLVHMLETMGLRTGVDLAALIAVSRRLPALLGHDIPGQVVRAGPSSRLHRAPDQPSQSERAAVW
jgi:hydroxymethylglutaryl-CoA lyase